MLDERYEMGPAERRYRAVNPNVGVALDATPARAEVNHGRLIACCPNVHCVGAEYVTRVDPVFWCDACENAELGGAYRPVVFPADQDLERAVWVLDARPHPQYRNWRPWTETVDMLEMENTAHGVDRGIVNRHEVIH